MFLHFRDLITGRHKVIVASFDASAWRSLVEFLNKSVARNKSGILNLLNNDMIK